MSIRFMDPMGEINRAPEAKPMRTLEVLEGRRAGLLWSQHVGSGKIWPALEKAVEARFKPSEIHRLYKKSTWNPAPPEEVEELARNVDYVIVGVGA